MLLANLVTRVYEESGDFSIDADRMLYSPYRRYAGIKSPQKDKEQLNTGANYTYEVASVDYLGKPQANTELDVKYIRSIGIGGGTPTVAVWPITYRIPTISR